AKRIACDDQFDVVGNGLIERARERPPVIGKNKTRREAIDDIPQFAEVARHQRIGGRYRRVGDADVNSAKGEQRVLDSVSGDYDDRLFGRQPTAKQGGADPLCVGEGLRVGKFAPLALRVPLRKKHAVRRSLRPIFQWFAQVVVIAAKTLRSADMNDAVRSLLK